MTDPRKVARALHELADEISNADEAIHVELEEMEGAIAFAKASEWAPMADTDAPADAIAEAMLDPRMYIGYGVVLGIAYARSTE
jgi:hypothetical protein